MEETSIWGLELGLERLEAVRLVRKSGRLELDRVLRIPLRKNISQQEGSELSATLYQALCQFEEASGITKEEPIALAVPGFHGASLPIHVAPVSNRLEELVEFELLRRPPFPPEEMISRFQILPTENPKDRHILLSAYPHSRIEAFAEAARLSKLKLVQIQSTPAALINFFRFDLRNLDRCLIVNLRKDGTDLLIGNEAGVWFRSLSKGIDSFIGILEKEFQLSQDEAKKILSSFLRGVPQSPYTIVCDEFLERIEKSLQQMLEEQKAVYPFMPPERVYLLGEGSRIPGVLNHFSSRFRCWTERAERPKRIFASEEKLAEIPDGNLYSLAPAIGVGLQAMGAISGASSFLAKPEKIIFPPPPSEIATKPAKKRRLPFPFSLLYIKPR